MTTNWHIKSFMSRENILGFVVGLSLVAFLFAISRIGAGNKHPKKSGNRNTVVAQNQLVFFDPPAFDFGSVMQQETIHHLFKLVNNSTNEMHIVGLRSSCSCTVLDDKLVRRTVAPKDSLMIPVEFRSTTYDGPVSSVVEVVLQTEDKERHVLQAQMQGKVNADFTMVPRSLDFGVLQPGQKATRTVGILPGALKEFTMSQPKVSEGPFEVSFTTNRNSPSTMESYEIAVTFSAPEITSSGVFGGAVEFETTSPRVPRGTIPVSATVIPEIFAAPEAIILPRETSGESRITVQTLRPSRIVRMLVIADGVPQKLESDDVSNPDEDDIWGLKHVRRINNSSLSNAKRVDFELEVRNGTGRNEARSASVHVRGL